MLVAPARQHSSPPPLQDHLMAPPVPHLVADEVPLLLVVVLAQEPGFVRG